MADGGEGTLEALGGANRSTTVSGPLGDAVDAEWRLSRGIAVIEMARASGLALLGGAEGNDPVAASTYGTGELIAAALDAGAKRIIVGVGGSATTDGGLGALRALYPLQRLRGVDLVVACDVSTGFLDAAEVFSAQKGASPAQVELLRRRLERLAQVYLDEYGVDVVALEGAGAAGGLAGGLAVLGAELVTGFELIAEERGLYESMEGADLVITGEGFLDEQSFSGKVVGGVISYAADLAVPVFVVAGEVYGDAGSGLDLVSLVAEFGEEEAMTQTVSCVESVVTRRLALTWRYRR
ncbi:MAG: Glycerate 2-kinase [Acidimicrobiales bacterium]|nr:Glycerate 2-kinase [Acidimicrobiales bacterium]